jgi:hypothetical protein
MAIVRRPGYSPAVRSIRFPRTALLASTMALLSSLACQQEEPKVQAADYPGEMAGGYCNAVFSCQCEDYPYASPNECFAELLEDYDTVNDEAFLSGLVYDGTCPAQELSEIESLACRGSIPAVPEGVCVPPCNVWHGTQQVGFPCQVLASSGELGLAWSNCGQGLTCNGEVCTNPCAGGGVALPAIGQPCPEGVCAAGAVCDATLTCVAAPPLPGAGQPCPDGMCNATSVCISASLTCAALPTIGNLCIEGQCDANSMCNGQICVARTPLACGLLGGGGFPGDGDGDPTTGDGDGDPTTGDGDGDPTAGDGDGDAGCSATLLPETVPTAWAGSTAAGGNTDEASCGGTDGPEDKLTYIAPTSGIYQISTEGSLTDLILYVRDGDCTGAELACNDDGGETGDVLSVSLSAGQEVTIIVDSYLAEGGDYVLAITQI